MKRPKKRSFIRDPVMFPFMIGMIAGMFAAANFMQFSLKSTRIWAGYYTLHVKAGPEARGLIDRLSTRLSAGRPIIGRGTAHVYYNDFTGRGESTISGLSERLDARDPRFDPYLKDLGGYFTSGEGSNAGEIVYIPAFFSAPGLYIRLLLTLGFPMDSSWNLVEFDPLAALAAVIGVCVFTLLLRWSSKDGGRIHSILLWAVSLCWLPLILSGGSGALLVFFVIISLCITLFRECSAYADAAASKDAGRMESEQGRLAVGFFVFILVSAGLVILSSFAGGSLPARLSALVCAITVSLSMVSIAFMRGGIGTRARKHAGFRPVKILKQEPGMGAFRWGLLATAVLAGAAAVVIPATRHELLPIPVLGAAANGLSWNAIELRRAESARPGALPDLVDAVAHAAYQDALPYGRSFGLPARGERVTLAGFRWDPERRVIVESDNVMLTYDAVWLAGVAARMQPGSVERMLLDQGRLVEVTVKSRAARALWELPFALICLAVLAAVFGPIPGRLLITGAFWRLNGAPRARRKARHAGGR